MSSGRSARLPPTPTATPSQTANNKHRVASVAQQQEPNSNNMMQYSSNATAAAAAAASGGLSGLGLSMGMSMGMGGMTSGLSSGGGGGGGGGVGGSLGLGIGGNGYGHGLHMGGGISTTNTATEAIPGETIDALGPELAVATSQVLENLSDNERKMIIEVLNRDESVRQRDATRIMLLRAELYSLRRKGVVKVGGGAPLEGSTQQQSLQQQPQQNTMQQQQQQLEHNNHNLHDSSRHCARCNTELGRITNRGAPCRACKLRVCKACREFTTRTTDWVCVVCHKQMEIQAASGEWLKDAYARGSCGAVDHLATSDVLRKSIRRSWTISNPEDDPNNPNAQPPMADNLYPQQQHLIEAQSAGSYPSLHHPHPQTRHQHHINYNTGSAIGISGIGTASAQHGGGATPSKWQIGRRVLRQSTLPSSLNNDPSVANYNSVNLTAPTSPHQLQKSPLYPSGYNSDDVIHMNVVSECDNYVTPTAPLPTQQSQEQLPTPTHHRLQVRRQSTLPANPCQPPPTIYMSTSPNRVYSRSPERSPADQQRYPPFMRQTSFPCNMSTEQPPPSSGSYATPHRTKLLPSTANLQTTTVTSSQAPPLSYDSHSNQSSMASDEMDYAPKARMMRQATLPNPEQHVKLLPTSPPKRQTSPQFRRSPEFMRQQTLPNPEAFSGNTLTVHPPPNANAPPAKFMPISPRAKQNFLFPSVPNPRQFLSQQNVPTVGGTDLGSGGSVASAAGEQYSSSQSVNIHSRDPHAKMIKVRSHSNEEYSNSKTHAESRRLLPEIPTNQRSMSRSPSRLVRQDCLKEEHGSRTFGEAKQQFNQFPDVTEELENRPEYADYFGDSSTSFLESDEVQYEKNYNAGFSSEPRIIYNDGSDDGNSYNQSASQRPLVYSAENVLTGGDTSYMGMTGGYYPDMGAPHAALPRTPLMHNRMRRRQSRELQMQQEEYAHLAAIPVAEPAVQAAPVASEAESGLERRKPEQMRSVSEDSGAKPTPKPVTRRSFSHPEKESQPQPKKVEALKIPSPRPLADILDKTRVGASKIPQPRRRNSRVGLGEAEEGSMQHHQYSFHQLLIHRNSDLAMRFNKTPPINVATVAAAAAAVEPEEPSKSQEPAADNGDKGQGEAAADEADDAASAAHTSTLGEQELQNAVEAAAVVFKKVVLQRRQEKEKKEKKEKAAEEASQLANVAAVAAVEGSDAMETSSELEFRCPTNQSQSQYSVEADEFKLVFLNSDSSSSCKEEEDDEGDYTDTGSNSSSTRQCHSIVSNVEDCDWDYFEPSMIATTTTTMISYAKSSDSNNSPLDSPLQQRRQLLRSYCSRIRESDTGTDEELLMQGESSSQTSSDGRPGLSLKARLKTRLLSKDHKDHHHHQKSHRCACSSSNMSNMPQYVAIPVPVPIPVPMASFPSWQPPLPLLEQDEQLCASLQQLWTAAAVAQGTPQQQQQAAAAAAAVVAAYSTAASNYRQQLSLAAASNNNNNNNNSNNFDATPPSTSQSCQQLPTTSLPLPTLLPPFRAGFKSSAPELSASLGSLMTQSLCSTASSSSSSGYSTAANVAGSLETLASSCFAKQQQLSTTTTTTTTAGKQRAAPPVVDGFKPTTSLVATRTPSSEQQKSQAKTSRLSASLLSSNAVAVAVDVAVDVVTPTTLKLCNARDKCVGDDAASQIADKTATKQQQLQQQQLHCECEKDLQNFQLLATTTTKGVDRQSCQASKEVVEKAAAAAEEEEEEADRDEANIHKNQVPTITTTTRASASASAIAAPAVITRLPPPLPPRCRCPPNEVAVENVAAETGSDAAAQSPLPSAQSLASGGTCRTAANRSRENKNAKNSLEEAEPKVKAKATNRKRTKNKKTAAMSGAAKENANSDVDCDVDAGHLRSESFCADSSADEASAASSSSSSEEEEEEEEKEEAAEAGEGERRKLTQRSYDVAEAMRAELSAEEEEERHHSTTDGASSSSSSASSSSSESCDSDDTGTVADRRPKRRRFHKIFIVNRQAAARARGGSSTEGDSLSSSEANLEDSSDNDTDTERTDCGIVLNYVKALPDSEEEKEEQEVRGAPSSGDESERQPAANSCDELANCIVVVGGRSDDDVGVVLHGMRAIDADCDADCDVDCNKKVAQLNASVGDVDCAASSSSCLDACAELHSISNDVNKLLALHKQNSELELKLLKLRRGVAEINEDYLAAKPSECKTPTATPTATLTAQLDSSAPRFKATSENSRKFNDGQTEEEEGKYVNSSLLTCRRQVEAAAKANSDNKVGTAQTKERQRRTAVQIKASEEEEEKEEAATACSEACKINDDDRASEASKAPEPETETETEQVDSSSSALTQLPVAVVVAAHGQADCAAEAKSVTESESPYSLTAVGQSERERERRRWAVENEMLSVAVDEQSARVANKNKNNNNRANGHNDVDGNDVAGSAAFVNVNVNVNVNVSDGSASRVFESCENATNETAEKKWRGEREEFDDDEYDKIFGSLSLSDRDRDRGDKNKELQSQSEIAATNEMAATTATTTTTTTLATLTTTPTNKSPNSSLSAKYRSLVMITKETKAPESNLNDYELANSINNNNNNNCGQNISLAMLSHESSSSLASESRDYSVDSLNENPKLMLEDGLADDDSWVEELSQRGDEEEEEELSQATTTPTATDSEDGDGDGRLSYMDREEELRGYHRSAIDFTLHTIVEESCEESEVASMRHEDDYEEEEADLRRRQRSLQHHHRLSASELEKYFFFGLGDGKVMSSIDTRGDDTASEVSSECSESLDSLPPLDSEQLLDDGGNSAADLASSRLEKYFLSGFMGFSGGEKQAESDASGGSVGSDSEGHPSPSQRRKRLVRARGTPRSHNSSLDNLLLTEANSNDTLEATGHGDSSESEAGGDDTVIHMVSAGERASDGSSSDTIKRKKQLRKRHDSLDDANDLNVAGAAGECHTPTPGPAQGQSQGKSKQHHHSRDSGFVGSNDDLLKAPELSELSGSRSPTQAQLEQISEDRELLALTTPPPLALPRYTTLELPSTSAEGARRAATMATIATTTVPPVTTSSNLVRKDSFNNWSSDEETNLMMSKMRQFFKTLIVATANAQQQQSKPTTPQAGAETEAGTAQSRGLVKSRPAQLAYFENELTRLMKTVPGINDEQVREIVEYLSSEDTWSDSYDSSDYTSSDLEGGEHKKGQLKAQISASCQQIINKFEKDEEGDRGDGGLLDETTHSLQGSDTALVYQKLVASFSKVALGAAEAEAMAPAEEDQPEQLAERSPQLFAKVMQHIGTRLVALMHEVSSGNETPTPAPRQPLHHHHHHHHHHHNHHKRLQAKISATTTEDEEDEVEEQLKAMPMKPALGYQQLKLRSKSHDLLLDGAASGHHLLPSSAANAPAGATSSSSGPATGEAGEECGVASDYERFSWRGSFESALLANGDSRTKLSQLDRDNSSSASALAVAKRRSAGDLLFNHQSLSREQLDRVRSCGSIGGGDEHHHQLEAAPAKPWLSSASSCADSSKDVRRSSVPDAIYETDSSEEERAAQFAGNRSTLPRSLAGHVAQLPSTNSLPRLPTSSQAQQPISQLTKSQSALNYAPTAASTPLSGGSAKSARYRSPGLAARAAAASSSSGSGGKKLGAGLQQFLYSKRDARKRLNMSAEEAKAAAEELSRSPVIGQRQLDVAASPVQSRTSSEAWPAQSDEDIDRLVAMHQNRSSMSSLGVRSESMASVYSGAGEGRYGTVVVKGQVEFGMQYNYKLGALEIHVVRCKDLAAVDAKRNRSDPYVKVYLLPDKSKAGKRKTKVKKHTLNPIFDETMRFHTPVSSLESRTLWLTVWHSDMFGRNDFLGEVSVNLQGRVFDNPQSQWYLLQERSEPFDEVATYRGDIVVGLKYIPPENLKSSIFSRGSSLTGSSSNLRKFGGSIKSVASKSDRSAKGGQLHVLVKEAKHLSPIKANGSCDAFCKSYLLPDRTRSSKQKTPVVKRTLHPTWNYTFVYEDVSLEDLSERALELTVWDHDRLASNEFVGGIRFSLGTGKSFGRQVEWMDATGKELSLWQNMLDRPNFWVEGSLVLRSSLDGIRALP